ncbi:glycosyltransferase [Pseudomonas sp. NPDC090203]|uniref:glycosyltransferase n=1 Tax=Pseudomonas sp. NPDC090203 TaxID=3364477 RepID=UPI0037F67435
MSVKYYGIYLAYAPGLDLRHEGLGRYLAAFVKGASERADVKFVLVCPSWSRNSLVELFSSEGVSDEQLEIVSPASKPMLLRVYEAYLDRKKRRRKSVVRRWVADKFYGCKRALLEHAEQRLVMTNSIGGILLLLIEAFIAALVAVAISPLLLFLVPLVLLRMGKRLARKVLKPLKKINIWFTGAVGEPKDDAFVLRLYRRMEVVESERMLTIINRMHKVRAWYSPTAFWPAFNEIKTPKLMCVPDVVLSDFPVGFSRVGGDRYLQTFEAVRKAIQTGDHFVTYSNAIKWDTLVDHYAVRPSSVTVIHHAPNILSQWVTTRGFKDLDATSTHYCSTLLSSALRKSSNKNYTVGFMSSEFKFLFYASQFRPNKNMLTLLRAYEYLLRHEFITHKLVLTGDPEKFPMVKKFIAEHGLQNDVLCLYGLSVQELAACYRLADVAVNPSLSEGGCPFTFTEALSVGTPVVMARIAVTEEVLTDEEMREKTFFDPYDWRDMAARIQWALHNREALVDLQKQTYERLVSRTWTDVVNEHIDVLDSISAEVQPVLKEAVA